MKNNYFYIILFISYGFTFEFSRFGGEFFKENIHTRESAMGGLSSFNAHSRNPAFLLKKEKNNIRFSHKKKYGDLLDINLLAYSFFINNVPFAAVGLNTNINNIPNTISSWEDNGDGILESHEINYNAIKMFSQNEYGLIIASAKNININNFSIKQNQYYSLPIGLRMKTNLSLIEHNYGIGFFVDTGTFIELSERLIIHSWIENILNLKYWNTGSVEVIIPNIILGMCSESEKINFGIETNLTFSGNIDKNLFNYINPEYNIGIEYISLEQLKIRLGTSFENILTAGFGVSFDILQFDYALIISNLYNIFPPSHQFEISFEPKYLKKYLKK